MRKNTETGDNLIVVNLAEAERPVFNEQRNREWITYGEMDNYDRYLLRLYNNSAKHNAIVTNKVKYVMGKGFGISDTAKADIHKNSNAYKFINTINESGEDIDEVAIKAAMDLEIYGGFYLEIIWTKGKTVGSISHCEYTKYRSNYDNTVFYYRKDGAWDLSSRYEKSIIAFNPNKPEGKQILYYKDYRPGLNTYTLPGYIGALNYIEADIEVGKHTYTNALSGFTPSKVINFMNGAPVVEEQKAIERRIKNKFTGSDGIKFLLTFNQDKDKAPTILDLGASDLTKEDFTAVDNLISTNIYAGHQITSPILFGIKEAGQLGGRNEMREAFEIFQNVYANAQQQKIETVFNWLASFSGISDKLEILRNEPVGFEFSENIQAANLTQGEIREKMGVSAAHTEAEELAQAIDKIKLLPSSVADKIISTLDINELRAMIGLKPTIKPEPKPPQQKFSEALETINDLGLSKQDFVIVKSKPVKFTSDKEMVESELEFWQFANVNVDISTKEAQILDLIKKDKRIEAEQITQALKISVKEVSKTLERLTALGYIKTKTLNKNGIETIERTLAPDVTSGVKKETVKEISIKYSYEEKPDVPAAITGSRPFCVKLMELDRLYDRKDIETMSQRLGYSVWDRKGGWYTNPETGITSPECRHEWKQNLVVKKK